MELKIELDTHLHVPKSWVDLQRIEEELTVEDQSQERARAMGFGRASDVTTYQLWEDKGHTIAVPRGYQVPYIRAFDPTVIDARPHWDTLDRPRFRLKLRKGTQSDAAGALLCAPGDKLLQLGCGKGKTILALWYALQHAHRTLIIVDRDFLVDQWMKEIKKCYWIPREHIGRVQGKHDFVGDYFTVASLKTLVQQEYDQSFYDQFGLVIFDECHVMAAPSFAPVVSLVQGERLGLSATPDRIDGLEPLFLFHMGGEPCYTDLEREQSSRWFFVGLPRIVSTQDESGCYQRMRGKRHPRTNLPMYALMRSRFDNFACESTDWENRVVGDISKAAAADRHILLLSSRKNHVRRLADRLDAMGIDCAVLTSEVKGKARKEAMKARVILATQQLASRALDIPRLDTLFLCFPTDDAGFLRQAVGRIDRIKDGKKEPYVVVYLHNYQGMQYRNNVRAYYAESLRKKADRMRSTLLEIDPKADIKSIGTHY